MKNHFKISELVITTVAISLEVADKLLKHHIEPLNQVREMLKMPVYISENSGYRPFRWEKNHGRDGDSEHVFRGKGAVDVTASDMRELLNCLITYSSYNRICWYPDKGFYHCDYASEDGKRHYYENGSKGWEWQNEIK